MSLPHGALCGSAVYDCTIYSSYTLTFSKNEVTIMRGEGNLNYWTKIRHLELPIALTLILNSKHFHIVIQLYQQQCYNIVPTTTFLFIRIYLTIFVVVASNHQRFCHSHIISR